MAGLAGLHRARTLGARLYHAHRCLAYGARGDGVEDWDLPFAYEALSRAHAVADDPGESLRYETLAREAGEGISNDEDRNHLLSELGTLRAARPSR